MEVLREIQPTVKPSHPPENALARVWFWNQAGAHSFICPAREVREHYRRLTSEGAVVWHTEIRDA